MPKLSRRRAIIGGAAAFIGTLAATPHARASGFVRVPGGKVWWERVGTGAGTPLLTLHGGPGAGHDYLHPLRALGDERPVIFYDQLGCGRSDAPPGASPYHVSRFVEELQTVRDALGLDRVILYGHSWGSMLAIEAFATGRAPGVERLVLGGALASIPQAVAGQRRLIEAMGSDGARLLAYDDAGRTSGADYQRLVERFYALHVYRGKPNADYAAAGANLERSPAYKWMNGPNEFTITGNLKHWDRRADLGRITVPTLIVTGQYDEITLDCHETIHRGVSNSRLVVLPGVSHLAMQERPATYVATLRPFLRGA